MPLTTASSCLPCDSAANLVTMPKPSTQPATSATPLRAVIYVRISKDREDETSTTTQLALCQAWCLSKGYQVVASYEDKGLSAFHDVKRPGLEAALKNIETKKADILVVWKLDRLVRNLKRFLKLYERISDGGGYLAITTHDVDTSGLMGQFFLMLLAMFAEFESQVKAERMEPFHEHRKAQGLPPGGPPCYGYRRQAKSLIIEPSEALRVNEVAQAVLDGESLYSILSRYEGSGLPTSNPGLKRFLTSPTIAGLRSLPDGSYQEGTWEPILTRETWEAVRALLMDSPRRRNYTQNTAPAHLLTGIIYCACGSRMNAMIKNTRTDNKPRYYCKAKGCNVTILKKVADDAVSTWLLMSIDDREWDRLRNQGRGHDPQVLKALLAEQDELAAMVAAKRITLSQFTIMNEALTADIESAHNDEPLNLPDLPSLQKGWGPLTVADQRAILTELLAAVTIHPAKEGQAPHERVTIDRKA